MRAKASAQHCLVRPLVTVPERRSADPHAIGHNGATTQAGNSAVAGVGRQGSSPRLAPPGIENNEFFVVTWPTNIVVGQEVQDQSVVKPVKSRDRVRPVEGRAAPALADTPSQLSAGRSGEAQCEDAAPITRP